MDSRLGSAVPRSYEDFQPQFEWLREEGLDTLLVDLSGFQKEQIKCQVINQRNLKLSGERPIDAMRWSRFRCDFKIPDGCATSDIRARFEDGLLYVTLPKSLPPVVDLPQPMRPPSLTAPKPSPKLSPEPKPSPEIPQMQKPSPKIPQMQKPSPKIPQMQKPSPKLSPEPKPSPKLPEAREKIEPKPSLKLPEGRKPSLKLPEERKPSLKLPEEPKPSPKPAALKEEWTKTPPPNEATKGKNQTSEKQTDPKANEIYEDASTAALPGAGGLTGKGDWGGMGDVLMGLKERPRELVVNVMVAVMVVVGVGIYLAYKVMSRGRGTH
ncbi:hypothetical protein QJS10_CPB15g02146 [Acorus calamus]|uniref:SHSP domain-containing protein n=1 Tax=Acorus calamus TaxID=4465 RepID=A0AAV9D8N7_ACOCL|nr:hypothetical protein QJS10_CPB15g02146 [Acorus calamus]